MSRRPVTERPRREPRGPGGERFVSGRLTDARSVSDAVPSRSASERDAGATGLPRRMREEPGALRRRRRATAGGGELDVAQPSFRLK